MHNPFETISKRLDSLEGLLLDALHKPIHVDIPDSSQQVYTAHELSRKVNKTVATIYRWYREGKIGGSKRGKSLYFTEEDLMNYINEGRQKSNSEIESEVEKYLSNNKKG